MNELHRHLSPRKIQELLLLPRLPLPELVQELLGRVAPYRDCPLCCRLLAAFTRGPDAGEEPVALTPEAAEALLVRLGGGPRS